MAYCKKEKANYHSKYVGNFQYLVKNCLQEEKFCKKRKGKNENTVIERNVKHLRRRLVMQ